MRYYEPAYARPAAIRPRARPRKLDMLMHLLVLLGMILSASMLIDYAMLWGGGW